MARSAPRGLAGVRQHVQRIGVIRPRTVPRMLPGRKRGARGYLGSRTGLLRRARPVPMLVLLATFVVFIALHGIVELRVSYHHEIDPKAVGAS